MKETKKNFSCCFIPNLFSYYFVYVVILLLCESTKADIAVELGLSIVYVPSLIVYWSILDAHLEVTWWFTWFVSFSTSTDCKWEYGKLYSTLDFTT